jgi:hypothetical protein
VREVTEFEFMDKKLLKNDLDWGQFKKEEEIHDSWTDTPLIYPCVVQWVWVERKNQRRDDLYLNFVYLNDFC